MSRMTSAPLNLLITLCNCDRLLAVPESHWPDILAVQLDSQAATIDMKVSSGLHWFDGHFPDQPVLPGVVQTHWACLLGSTVFDLADEFSALTRLKFKTPVLPGQTLTLALTYVAARDQINYRYHHNETVFSSGTLHFGNSGA